MSKKTVKRILATILSFTMMWGMCISVSAAGGATSCWGAIQDGEKYYEKENDYWIMDLEGIDDINSLEAGRYIDEGEWTSLIGAVDDAYNALAANFGNCQNELKEEKFGDNCGCEAIYARWVAAINAVEAAVKVSDGSKYVENWQFGDVAAEPGNWKYEAVKFITESGIMKGTSANEFKPDDSLTRAMFATMLYRMAGEPSVTFTNKFPDVPANKWYSNAVIWASEQEIVSGYSDGRFGTDDYITREQIAKMLMQFGKVQGYDVSQRADFVSFADAEKVSGWANDYMKWAVGSGMIGGSKKDGISYLNPKGNATRAESATMLKRFIEKY